VPFQNANHSVRVTDAFMRAVVEDGPWHLLARDGQILDTIPAKSVWRAICEAAHECGDPGLQFDTTINEMHTTPNHGRINASNPCSEYMHVDDSACNLASLNLRKFQTVDGKFNADELLHAVDVMILAQDILVDNARYPTGKIGANAKKFRQLGLGYANLGALLMSMGLPYDSEEGRTMAGAITALMCGRAYRRSAEIAKRMGKFEGSKGDEHNMMHVIEKHRASCKKLELQPYDFLDLIHNAYKQWSEAAHLGATHGYRNAQATVLAPTGTIGFMMDCDTTGIEPDTALVKTKKLVGGGKLRMVNQTVVAGLQNLGYHPQIVKEIMDHVSELGTIEGSQHILSEHLPVFDCAFATANGRSLRPEAHVLMMGAVQPFISGAISKTCNMPYNATVQDVENIYMLAWVRGIKAIAIYRDGCKRSQPLSTLNTAVTVTSTAAPKNVADVTKEIYNWLDIVKPNGAPLAIRRRLPDERNSYTHKFSIAGHEGYITVGMYNDGSPGEIFVRMAKEGSAVSGLMDCFATVTSIALQHGVPLEALVEKFAHTKFEPSGFSTNPNIGMTTSIMDYLFRWLRQKFLMTNPLVNASISDTNVSVSPAASQDTIETVFTARMTVIDHNLCPNCGSITVRTGTCHACPECAWSGGCG
jgi:ribonucleoside-diphosphate reductase alpha chain